MLLGLSFDHAEALQKIVLLLNTVLLIGVLVAAELVYSEATKKKRQQLRYFLPLILVLGSLLMYAIYKQEIL